MSTGDASIFRLLLDYGVDVNDQKGKVYPTALHAAREGQKLKFLLDHGADVNITVGNHGAPLHFAFATGKIEYAGLLLASCPDLEINAQGGEFGSALQAAAHVGALEHVQTLLDRGADVNAGGGKYGSAINAAIVRGCWSIVELLLKAGAKSNIQHPPESQEKWLSRVEKEDGRMAVERYARFMDKQKSAACGCTSCEQDFCWWKAAGYHE